MSERKYDWLENDEVAEDLKSCNCYDQGESASRNAHHQQCPYRKLREMRSKINELTPEWTLIQQGLPDEDGKYLTYWSDGELEIFRIEQEEREMYRETGQIRYGKTWLVAWTEQPEVPEQIQGDVK